MCTVSGRNQMSSERQSCDRSIGTKSTRHEANYPLSCHHPLCTPAKNTDMSLPHSVVGLSKKRKHSAAEHGDKRMGSSGANPGDFEGPPPAPAHRGHLQGQEFDTT